MAMSVPSYEARREAAAAMGARRELGPEYEAQIAAGLAERVELARALHDYFAWATTTTMDRYPGSAEDVPDGLTIPRWSWDGLVE